MDIPAAAHHIAMIIDIESIFSKAVRPGEALPMTHAACAANTANQRNERLKKQDTPNNLVPTPANIDDMTTEHVHTTQDHLRHSHRPLHPVEATGAVARIGGE